ncbi:hypothetical protein AB4Y35_37385 [Paraburkholderia sp. EG286A]|uniref:hypothetical protein n=1 Tax=Paraburkholderia sp. EG286A TaxID=3237014 RepID=UPI0034D29DAF
MQKHQLDGSASAPIVPETLVKRGDVAVSQREVAFDIVPVAWMIAAGASTFASEGQV